MFQSEMMPSKDTQNKNLDTHRINQAIRAREVFLIDETGNKVGVLPFNEALRRAQVACLDLIEVSPDSKPPVCKIQDYGKLIYEKKKLLKKNEHNRIEIKEIQFGCYIEAHDLSIKARKAKEFLAEGDKVKIRVKMKGREATHPELARQTIENFMKILGADYKFEKDGLDERNTISGSVLRVSVK